MNVSAPCTEVPRSPLIGRTELRIRLWGWATAHQKVYKSTPVIIDDLHVQSALQIGQTVEVYRGVLLYDELSYSPPNDYQTLAKR